MGVLNNSVMPVQVSDAGYDIENSLRFNDDDSAYLSRTPSSAGNRRTWTWSGWVKFGEIQNSNGEFLLIARSGTTWTYVTYNPSAKIEINSSDSGATTHAQTTDAVFRDPSAWYHINIACDTTQATASERIKLYANGVLQDVTITTQIAQNANTNINSTIGHMIGSNNPAGTYFDGYLSEVNFIDGQALTPSDFGEEDAVTGQWKPKAYTGTYGTNGFYLDFSNSGDLGNDVSGNNNDWSTSGLSSVDQMVDTPTNNFCTLNPLAALMYPLPTLSQGNLHINSITDQCVTGTQGVSSGKRYYEVVRLDEAGATGGNNLWLGFIRDDGLSSSDGIVLRSGDANSTAEIRVDGSVVQTGLPYVQQNDIVGVALDLDANTIQFYVNNNTLGTAVTVSTVDMYVPFVGNSNSSDTKTIIANFGQDSSFAGNKTAQGNQDSNGIGDFYYEPPEGFLALCEDNLPDDTVVPEEHFAIGTYTGNGSTQSITGLGFQPDLVWAKSRNSTDWHILQDRVRGAGYRLYSNETNVEAYSSEAIQSFDTDGFTLGNYDNINGSGDSMVYWAWKANGSPVSNTDGSITSQVSANVDAGFSIVGYTGNGTAGATVGHGLSQAPELIIVKNRNTGTAPFIVCGDVGDLALGSKILRLNSTSAAFSNSNQIKAIDSSVFTHTYNGTWSNENNKDHIAYCFHSVDGYSKVGSYTGNGSSDGLFVYCGFRPAYVMVKRTDSTSTWSIFDADREPTNDGLDSYLMANQSNAETTYNYMDFLSNGFKLRNSETTYNNSGANVIYYAIAESSFKNSNAR